MGWSRGVGHPPSGRPGASGSAVPATAGGGPGGPTTRILRTRRRLAARRRRPITRAEDPSAVPFRVIPFRDRLLNRLVKRATEEAVDRDGVVVAAGSEARHAVLVRRGYLEVREGSGGHPDPDEAGDGAHGGRVVDLVLPWELAGLDALVEGRRHPCHLVAPAGAVVQRLDGRGVRRVLRRAEGTFDAFHGAAREHLELLRALGPGRATPAAHRLALVLLHLARRADDGAEGPTLPFDVPHRVLGEIAGIHRSTVTTHLNDWLYRELLEDREVGWRVRAPDALLRATAPR